MASIRPCPKSPSKLEIRFTCAVTKKPRSVAVGSGDRQAAERLKAKIEDVILKVRNGEKKKPSAHLIKKKDGLKDWYISGGSVVGLDLRSEWLEDIEGTIAFSTLEGYRQHIESFDLADPKLTLKDIQSRFTVRTAKKYKATFGTYWSWLVANDYSEAPNPVRGFKFDKAETKEGLLSIVVA